uniref:Probable pectate lyase F n=1 Tax=Peronospora matthiolae TaxID=2874970 RepID=A0AAV1UIM5_9STRA
MRSFVALVAFSYALASHPITTAEEEVTMSRLRRYKGGGRNLIEDSIDTTPWREDYTPGEVTAVQYQGERTHGVWPLSAGTVVLHRPGIVGPIYSFDGGMKTFKRRNVAFESGVKMKKKNAVFVVQAGGVLRNVIIAGGGGIFCETHNCALVNVWFKDSVQAALHINSGTGITTVTGGGAKNVAGRVIFGQASGTVVVSGGFHMEHSGMLFESCSTCGPAKRGIVVDGVVSLNPTAELIRVNSNYDDRGTIASATITTTDADYPLCTLYNGGVVPQKLGTGAFPPICSFSRSNVKIKPVEQAV